MHGPAPTREQLRRFNLRAYYAVGFLAIVNSTSLPFERSASRALRTWRVLAAAAYRAFPPTEQNGVLS